jgi:hypothetical protein
LKPDTPVCKTEQSGFDKLALMLLLLDSQLYCDFFATKAPYLG